MHSIWQRIRRPFVYPKCVQECKWEIYDVTSAGCLKCGREHVCQKMAFQGDCPLIQNDDGSRVCLITGYVIPEVRYSNDEYLDHVVFKGAKAQAYHHHRHANKEEDERMQGGGGGGGTTHHPHGHSHNNSQHMVVSELETEVNKIIDKLLDSSQTVKCRNEENQIQIKKIVKSFIKSIRMFKLSHPGKMPNMCDLLTCTVEQEKKISFIYPISAQLKRQCSQNVLLCLLQLKNKGFRIYIGNKLQDLVCGLVYLMRTGISYKKYELLKALPEIGRCLPAESRLKMYFGINSKVITAVENEVKLAFRDYLQD